MKDDNQINLGGDELNSTLKSSSIAEESWDGNWRQEGNEAETTEECCLPAYSPQLAQSALYSAGPPARAGTASCELDPPISFTEGGQAV